MTETADDAAELLTDDRQVLIYNGRAPRPADEAADFDARMTAFQDQIVMRIICTHQNRAYDGEPIVLVAYLHRGMAVPDYRYWSEEISEVGGRAEAIADARGTVLGEKRPGTPKFREVFSCACGIRFPFRSDKLRRVTEQAAAGGLPYLDLKKIPDLIRDLPDTPDA